MSTRRIALPLECLLCAPLSRLQSAVHDLQGANCRRTGR